MKNPLVSVVLPAYNSAKYIAEAIESILNQTFKDFELLVVVDPSNDSTEDIIRRFIQHDSRVFLIQNKYEKSLSGSLNTGIEKAKGKYIARADADDINRIYRFEKQVNYLESHPDIYLLGGGYAPFNENGHRLDIFHPTSSIEIAYKFLSNSYFAHPTVMFRKEIYDEIGGYSNVVAEDFAYFSGITQKYKTVNLPIILIDYRESKTQRSFEFAKKVQESVQKQYLQNFKYYVGNIKNSDIFYDYVANNKVYIKDIFKIIKINDTIIKKISKTYQISFLSYSFISIYLKIMIISILKTLKI